jgi:hypothetical protein
VGRQERVKTAGVTLIAMALLCSSGCVTRPDWIQATLVTVDVAGVWQGTASANLGWGGTRFVLDLEQKGMRVTGNFHSVGGSMAADRSGALEGSVGGDVLSFTVQSPEGSLSGELAVSLDQMEGVIRSPTGRNVRVVLRRAEQASPQGRTSN